MSWNGIILVYLPYRTTHCWLWNQWIWQNLLSEAELNDLVIVFESTSTVYIYIDLRLYPIEYLYVGLINLPLPSENYLPFVEFLAATKRLWGHFCPSVRLSARLLHLFHNGPVFVSSWDCQVLLPMTKVMSTHKVKVRGQRSRSQRSKPNLAKV